MPSMVAVHLSRLLPWGEAMISSPGSFCILLRSLSSLRCAEVDILIIIQKNKGYRQIELNLSNCAPLYQQSLKIINPRGYDNIFYNTYTPMTSKQARPLEYYLEGKENSKSLIVFMQGWPDNNQVWEPLEWKETISGNRLLFINFPNSTKTQENLKWGQDFPVIVDRIKATLDEIEIQKFEKKVIVAHDWGCFYTYLLDQKYPGTVNEIITLDVPGYVQLSKITQIIFVVVYQFILLAGFLLGGWPGKLLTQGMCKFMKYQPKYLKEINGARNYPYYYLYRNKVLSLLDKKRGFLYQYRPSVPIVYIYGTKKPFQFHGDKWTHYLREHDKCEMHGLQSGHWIMNKHAKFITDLILRRLKAI